MLIENDLKLDFNSVLIKPKRSSLRSRKDVVLERKYKFKHSGKTWTGIPLIAANMDQTGTFEMAKALTEFKMLTCARKSYTLEDWKKENTALIDIIPTIGASDKDIELLKQLHEEMEVIFKFICIDVANGYGEYFSDFVSKVRNLFPRYTIVAGNVCTPEMTEELIMSGADIVKVGIGSGSVCTTRILTGVGYPQLSAVVECADAAHGLNGHIISDGGCTCAGDVAKAFGAGADFVMLGGMLAGHDECDGNNILYGMSSKLANEIHNGGLKDYRAAEGKVVHIEPKGSVRNTINEILGGLRSTCTYVGAASLKQFSKCTTFIRVNNQVNKVFN